MSRILDGKAAAAAIRGQVAEGVAALVSSGASPPCLATVLVGAEPASAIYVRNKVRACREVGITPREHQLPATLPQSDLIGLVEDLGRDRGVDGILVQMPLPSHVDARAVIEAVDPAKDVDGFHPVSVGRLWSSADGFAPCTPSGIIELLDREGIAIEGAEAVVVGRSDIVGRPMAALLLRRHATVTVCHSRTRDLPRVAARADILVAAIGRPAFITSAFIKPGATVVDVGINRVTEPSEVRRLFGDDPERLDQLEKTGSTLVGDVHPIDVRQRAGAYTPVPGGVGPLTIAMLLRNTLVSARLRHG